MQESVREPRERGSGSILERSGDGFALRRDNRWRIESERQRDDEFGALIGAVALRGDGAVMQFDDVFGDGQTETETAVATYG